MDGLIAFFTNPANWAGEPGIPNRLFEHLVISGLAILAATLIALPIGLYIGHTGRGANLAINLANIGRAVPSYAIMVILAARLTLTLAPVLGYSASLGLILLPILVAMTLWRSRRSSSTRTPGCARSTASSSRRAAGWACVSARSSDRSSCRSPRRSSSAGFRTATLQVIATATIGAILSGGGLGRFIIDGLSQGLAGDRRSTPARSS